MPARILGIYLFLSITFCPVQFVHATASLDRWACTQSEFTSALTQVSEFIERLLLQSQDGLNAIVELSVQYDLLQNTDSVSTIPSDQPQVRFRDDSPDRMSEWFVNEYGIDERVDYNCTRNHYEATGEWFYTHTELHEIGCIVNETSVLTEYCPLFYPDCPNVFDRIDDPLSPSDWVSLQSESNNSTDCPSYCLNPMKYNNSLINFYDQFTLPSEYLLKYLTTQQSNAEMWIYASDRGCFRRLPPLEDPIADLFVEADYMVDQWLFKAYYSETNTLSPIFLEVVTQRRKIDLVQAVRMPSGEIRGTWSAGMFLNEIEDSVYTFNVTENSLFLLVDSQGKVIYGTQQAFDLFFCPTVSEFCMDSWFNITAWLGSVNGPSAEYDLSVFDSFEFGEHPAFEPQLEEVFSDLLQRKLEMPIEADFNGMPTLMYWETIDGVEPLEWFVVGFVPTTDIIDVAIWTAEPTALAFDSFGETLEVVLINDGLYSMSWSFERSPHESHFISVVPSEGSLMPGDKMVVEVKIDETTDLTIPIRLGPQTAGYSSCFSSQYITLSVTQAASVTNEVIGGVVGALAFILICVYIAVLWYKKRTNQKMEEMKKKMKAEAKEKLLRDQLDRAQLFVERQSRWIAYLFHEVRNPLSGIKGGLDYIPEMIKQSKRKNETLRNEELEDEVTVMITCVYHIQEILDNVLDMAKLEENKLILDKDPMNVRTCCQHAVATVKRSVDPNVEVLLTCDESLWILGSKRHVAQILINLMSNAAKYTKEGFIELRVTVQSKKDHLRESHGPVTINTTSEHQPSSLSPPETPNNAKRKRNWERNECQFVSKIELSESSSLELNDLSSFSSKSHLSDEEEKGKKYVKFEVLDTGCGISKENQDKVFERFEGINSHEVHLRHGYTEANSIKGAGLGLHISQQLARLMNDKTSIQITSPWFEGRGSIFYFSVPTTILRDQREESVSKQLPVEDVSALIPKKLKILVVDDVYSPNRRILLRIFTKIEPFNNFEVSCFEAENGEAALELMERQTFDIVTLDENMSQSGGVLKGSETAEEIRKNEKDLDNHAQTILISVTGNCTVVDRRMYEKCGFDVCWEKPLPKIQQMYADICAVYQRRKACDVSCA